MKVSIMRDDAQIVSAFRGLRPWGATGCLRSAANETHCRHVR
jgi:hypothetical protein